MAAMGLLLGGRADVVVVLFLTLALFASHAHAYQCDEFTFCSGSCCDDSYGDYYCCDDFIYAWWFWFVWVLFFILLLTSCCALCRRRRMRQRQVIVVQQGYTTTTGYGTLVSTNVPQQPVLSPAYAHAGRYPHPPPGPPPSGVMPSSAPAPAYQQGAAGMQQAQAPLPYKHGEPSTYATPPPYNNGI